MVITSQIKKRSPQERKLLKNRKKAHKVPIGVISHFFTVNNFFISTPSERSFSPDCKSQYKNVGLGQYKNVGFPTFLYCLFSLHLL